jgi:hypothetical protein
VKLEPLPAVQRGIAAGEHCRLKNHIAFDPEVVRQAVAVGAGQFEALGRGFTELAIRAFLSIRLCPFGFWPPSPPAKR